MSKTFYEVLDVSADASEAAIKDAYREKVKESHPDVSDRPDAAERFKRVKRAEEVLCDPVERAAYDRLGHETYLEADTSGGVDAGSDASEGGVDGDAGGKDDEGGRDDDESAGSASGAADDSTDTRGSGPTTVEDVRDAAARTAGRDHDAGGRSAGWRERERRAGRRRAADWFGGASSTQGASDASAQSTRSSGSHVGRSSHVSDDSTDGDWIGAGFDYENPGSRWTYDPSGGDDAGSSSDDVGSGSGDVGSGSVDSESDVSDTESRTAASAADPTSDGAGTGSAGVASDGSGGSSATARAAGDRDSGSGRSATWPTDGPGGHSSDRRATAPRESRHAASEAWGNRETRDHTHAVHGWRSAERQRQVPRPDWTQDDVVALAATMLLYPIFLLLTAVPAFHVSVNVVAGVATLAYVAGLLPRPSMALPVFGTWSVGMPALLLAVGVPVASVAFVVAVGGVWVPFLFAVAVASVLVR